MATKRQQHTAAACTPRLLDAGLSISMVNRRWSSDNAFMERVWETMKYEDLSSGINRAARTGVEAGLVL